MLLIAAIDYAVQTIIVYEANEPLRSTLKSYAKLFDNKVLYIPIGQLSAVTSNRIRIFHVLDGYDKRTIADEYVF